MSDETVAQLRREVLEPLKYRFVERDEVIDLLALAVVAGEDLARQLAAVEAELGDSRPGEPSRALSLTALARLRERAADLADRAAWIADDGARKHLLQRSGQLLKRLG